jgi:predicted ATPase/DNA-binding winged helix-turn-helix (wHTH) protein
MDPASEASAIIEFGRFRVLPDRRELLADGRPIKLGSRAFDLLMVLIKARGELVTKDEILNRVWPGTVVEENNLHIQISVLRKVLGGDRGFIQTQSGRGYRFVAQVTTADAEQVQGNGSAAPISDARIATNLPATVSDLIGRDAELGDVADLIAAHRLVTLTGPGGIGKTRLGIEVARHVLPKFADGAWIVELAPLADPDLVAATVATALGLKLGAGAMSADRVAAALGSKHLLLVLDNCEHIVDAAASMAEALLRAGPAVHVMATSREPLRAENEHVVRVPPLAVPAEGSWEMDHVRRYGALRLFFERARAADPQLAPDMQLGAIAGAICRRLDGIPLAIELAASRVGTLGLEEIAARLDDRFRLLAGGRRTALPRHQTLRATLDWSNDLLPEPERLVLRRLAIFVGAFSLEAASTIGAIAEIAAPDVVDSVTNLVTKSLVTADFGDSSTSYQLLETTRAYALEKLTESGELQQIARRHAEHCRDLLERAEGELDTLSSTEWLSAYGRRIDDVRAALDWAFSPTGDASIGVALTVAAVPLWFRLSLVEECGRRVERALSSIGTASTRDSRREMQLLAALGASLTHTKGLVRETEAAWTKVLDIAARFNDAEYQLQALHGMWSYRNNSGDFRTALALAQRFFGLAVDRADPADLLIADRMIGVVLHYLGDQVDARHHIERMLDRDVAHLHRSNTIRSLLDHRVRALSILARLLWLQGFPDQAIRTAQSAVEDARSSIDHAISLCYALAQAGAPVALFMGDLAKAERFVAMLLDHSARHELDVWHARGRCFEGVLLIARGEAVSGLRLLRPALDEVREKRSALYYMNFLVALAQGLGGARQVADGLLVVDEALAYSERIEERWCLAELLRIKGTLLLLAGAPKASAEAYFRQALDWGHRQGALSWELRAATSLAGLWRDQGRTKEAHELLAPIYDRFTEGFETADLRAAKSLIDDL